MLRHLAVERALFPSSFVRLSPPVRLKQFLPFFGRWKFGGGDQGCLSIGRCGPFVVFGKFVRPPRLWTQPWAESPTKNLVSATVYLSIYVVEKYDTL